MADSTVRIVTCSAIELQQLVSEAVASQLEGLLDGKRGTGAGDAEGLLDRAGAAGYLRVSLSKLDLLCRREQDPLPYSMVGDARRFERSALLDWTRRQPKGDQ